MLFETGPEPSHGSIGCIVGFAHVELARQYVATTACSGNVHSRATRKRPPLSNVRSDTKWRVRRRREVREPKLPLRIFNPNCNVVAFARRGKPRRRGNKSPNPGRPDKIS